MRFTASPVLRSSQDLAGHLLPLQPVAVPVGSFKEQNTPHFFRLCAEDGLLKYGNCNDNENYSSNYNCPWK